jgi:hypothetical protein
MAWTENIASEMGVSKSLVNSVAEKIGVSGGYKYNNGSYSINDFNVPKLKLEVIKWHKEEVKKYIDEFGVDSQHTEKIAKEYKMEEYLEKENKTFQSENQALKFELSKLQEKLDLIAKEKLEIAEIVAKIAERFF